MSSLSALPAELKLCVAELLGPDDCFYFAFIDKDIWQLCKPVVHRHKLLVEKYGSICTESGERTLWKLLDDILDKPSLTQYVKEVEVGCTREAF